jgi:hypothetical protein
MVSYSITSINDNRIENINKIKSIMGDGYLDIKKFNSGNTEDIEEFKSMYPNFNLNCYLDEPAYITQDHRKSGEIGCWMSNFHIWNYIVQNNIDFMVAIEDDCHFQDGMLETIINLGSEKDLFLFGEWAELYSLTNKGARDLISSAFDLGFRRMPMDEYLFIYNRSEETNTGRLTVTRQLVQNYPSNIANSGYDLIQ